MKQFNGKGILVVAETTAKKDNVRGTSLAAVIPQEIVQFLKIEKGNKVRWLLVEDGSGQRLSVEVIKR